MFNAADVSALVRVFSTGRVVAEKTKKNMKQHHLHYLPSCTIQTEKRSTKRIAGPDLANPMARSVQDSIIQIAATWASARLRRSII